MTEKPTRPVDSASVLIIRDGTAHACYGTLQILMVRRHPDIRFAGGAYVFPGGKLDEPDRELEQEYTALSETREGFYGLRFTALREVFEETGLIIGTMDGKPVDEIRWAACEARYRGKFLNGSITLREFLEQSGIELAVKNCYSFARWITPEVYPIRFDTRFFLCAAPKGQIPTPDGREITEAQWVHPMTLVEESNGVLMFPTMMNLKMLGQAKSVSEAFAILADRNIVTVMPEVITGDKVRFRKIPDAAGYGDVDQSRTRTAININKS